MIIPPKIEYPFHNDSIESGAEKSRAIERGEEPGGPYPQDQSQMAPDVSEELDGSRTKSAAERVRNFPVLTALACGVCVLIFIGLLQEGNPSWDTLSKYGAYSSLAIWRGKYWGLLTSVFVHIQIYHVFFNVYWLWILGGALEQAIGKIRWLILFGVAAFVSSAVELGVAGETGIGVSGVLYAIFGFMWMAKGEYVKFQKILPKKTVNLFLVWLGLCVILTAAKVWNVGNAAHISGLLFGVFVATIFVTRRRQRLAIAGLIMMLVGAIMPLVWCPWSATWTALRAYEAHQNRNYAEAVIWYQRSLNLGENPAFVLQNMAIAYLAMGDNNKWNETLDRLRKIDPKAAQAIEDHQRSTTP